MESFRGALGLYPRFWDDSSVLCSLTSAQITHPWGRDDKDDKKAFIRIKPFPLSISTEPATCLVVF